MIRSANELREVAIKNHHYEVGYKKAVESVMRTIERASENGLRKTCFNPSAYWYETEYGTDGAKSICSIGTKTLTTQLSLLKDST